MACFWSHLQGVRQECPEGWRYFRILWETPEVYTDYTVSELRLYEAPGGTEISLDGATATSNADFTSMFDGQPHPERAIDGDEYTAFSFYDLDLPTATWLKIDMGEGNTVTPGAYSLRNYQGTYGPHFTWKFQASNDGSNWDTLQDVITFPYSWGYYGSTHVLDLADPIIDVG